VLKAEGVFIDVFNNIKFQLIAVTISAPLGKLIIKDMSVNVLSLGTGFAASLIIFAALMIIMKKKMITELKDFFVYSIKGAK
jgi:hypothetical protein